MARSNGLDGSSGLGGARVAVTGAGGFIGRALALRLVAGGAEVVGIDVSPTAAADLEATGIEPAVCDVTDARALAASLSGCARVFHTAAHVHEGGDMREFIRVNVFGTATVIDAARAAGAERVVHVSSVVVYGYADPAEQGDGAHLRTYGIPYIDTKSASDRVARRRGAIVVRPGDVYGPGSVPWVIRPLGLAAAGRLSVPGAGDGWMLPVYIDDLVEALVLAGERAEPGAAYAAWDGSALTFGEYFDRIGALAGTGPARRLPRPALEAAGSLLEGWARLRGRAAEISSRSATFIDRRGSVSTELTRRELGWEPRVSLDEGLARTAAWAAEQGLIKAP